MAILPFVNFWRKRERGGGREREREKWRILKREREREKNLRIADNGMIISYHHRIPTAWEWKGNKMHLIPTSFQSINIYYLFLWIFSGISFWKSERNLTSWFPGHSRSSSFFLSLSLTPSLWLLSLSFSLTFLFLPSLNFENETGATNGPIIIITVALLNCSKQVFLFLLS